MLTHNLSTLHHFIVNLKLLFLINQQWTSPFLDRLMALASCLPAWTPPALLLLLFILIRGSFRSRTWLLVSLLILGINDGLIANPLKKLVNRPRPYQVVADLRIVDLAKATPRILAIRQPPTVKISEPSIPDPTRPIAGRSFPSAHTTNTLALALITACFYRRFGWLAFFPALLVGYSRIYVGSHWPSDVLFSILLSLTTTSLLLLLAAFLWKRSAHRLFPRLHLDHPRLFSA